MLLTTPLPSVPPEVVQNAADGSGGSLWPPLLGALVGGIFAIAGSWWSQSRANKNAKELQEQGQANALVLHQKQSSAASDLQRSAELAKHCDTMLDTMVRHTLFGAQDYELEDWADQGFESQEFRMEYHQAAARIRMWCASDGGIDIVLDELFGALTGDDLFAAGRIQQIPVAITGVDAMRFAGRVLKHFGSTTKFVHTAFVDLPTGSEAEFQYRVMHAVRSFQAECSAAREQCGVDPRGFRS